MLVITKEHPVVYKFATVLVRFLALSQWALLGTGSICLSPMNFFVPGADDFYLYDAPAKKYATKERFGPFTV